MSALPDDVCVIAGSFGAAPGTENMEYRVRGVLVAPLRLDPFKDSAGRVYRWCQFPDQRVMLVNEGNILSRKKGRYDATAVGDTASRADRGD